MEKDPVFLALSNSSVLIRLHDRHPDRTGAVSNSDNVLGQHSATRGSSHLGLLDLLLHFHPGADGGHACALLSVL